MRTSLASLCDRFIENRDIIKSTFKWESTYFYPVCAAIFTNKRQTADEEKLKECRDILKKQVGVFSNFRGTGKLSMISMLATDAYPEEKLENALVIYKALKQQFFGSEYLPVASMMISELTKPENRENIVERTRHIYELMKSEHPFLTSREDSVFAAMLALSPLTDEQIIDETEACYKILKPEFFSGNAVQSLSHTLALGEGTPEVKCKRTMDLFSELKNRGCRYGTSYELATLGVLAMLPAELANIADDIAEVDEFLSNQRGYGALSMGKKQRLMHAGMIVTSDYIGASDSAAMQSAAIGATISLIVAQQAAMCAAIAASSSASASASSGGN